jgi:ATP-dependent Clp protease ATP-binding subunit ClpB
LLQILEEGRLTDAQGRSTDFRNTVLIMTSNLGTQDLRKANVGFGKNDEALSYQRMRDKVNEALKGHFRPEFLNRIDETILFKPLTLEEITTIVDLLLADLNQRLADRRVTVLLDKKAKEWAAEKGYDPVFGARPLKRFLQRNIETQLARALIAGAVAEGSEVKFVVKGDALTMK